MYISINILMSSHLNLARLRPRPNVLVANVFHANEAVGASQHDFEPLTSSKNHLQGTEIARDIKKKASLLSSRFDSPFSSRLGHSNGEGGRCCGETKADASEDKWGNTCGLHTADDPP